MNRRARILSFSSSSWSFLSSAWRSLQWVVYTTGTSHLVPQEAALLLQLLFVDVDQALQHVGLKKLGAHLEVDNLEELLNSKDWKGFRFAKINLQIFLVLDTLGSEVKLELWVDCHLLRPNPHLEEYKLK